MGFLELGDRELFLGRIKKLDLREPETRRANSGGKRNRGIHTVGIIVSLEAESAYPVRIERIRPLER